MFLSRLRPGSNADSSVTARMWHRLRHEDTSVQWSNTWNEDKTVITRDSVSPCCQRAVDGVYSQAIVVTEQTSGLFCPGGRGARIVEPPLALLPAVVRLWPLS